MEKDIAWCDNVTCHVCSAAGGTTCQAQDRGPGVRLAHVQTSSVTNLGARWQPHQHILDIRTRYLCISVSDVSFHLFLAEINFMVIRM